MDIVRTFTADLGEAELKIEASQAFIDKLVAHFELKNADELTPELVKSFLVGSLDGAAQKLDT